MVLSSSALTKYIVTALQNIKLVCNIMISSVVVSSEHFDHFKTIVGRP